MVNRVGLVPPGNPNPDINPGGVAPRLFILYYNPNYVKDN